MQSGYLAARLRRSAAISVVFAATCASAFAQTPSQPPAPGVDAIPPAEQTEDEGDRVVITGSRIARDAFTSTAPIQVITAEMSTLEGLVDTAEIIQGSSIAQGSTQLNNSFGNFVVEGGPGINSVSLRGLGAQRSLVLLNNQRPGPAGVRGQVGAFDLNVVPDSIISRVEILKDGASSVYGSDAVAGVVNIITRTSVDSPELNIQYNATEQGGGNSLQVNGAIGFDFFGGNLMLAAEYEDRDPLKYGDRKNLACAQDLVYDPTTGRRIDLQDRSILAGTSLGGCTTGNIYFNTVQDLFSPNDTRYIPSPNGVTIGPFPGYRPRNNTNYDDFPGAQAFYEDVLNSPKFLEGYAISAVERLSLYGRADFNILSDVNWTTDFLYTRRDFEHKNWRQFFPIIGSNLFYDVPGAFQAPAGLVGGAARAARPVTIWPDNQWVNVDYYYVNSGLEGEFFVPGWEWTLNASYSRSEGDYKANRILKETAGDATEARPSDGLYAGPNYNPFDPAFLSGNYSQATFDLLTGYPVGNTVYDQTIVQGVISGDLFELPAGPLGFAAGAEWRHFTLEDIPSEGEQNDEYWGVSSANITAGDDTVSEIFAEVNVPVLRGVPFIEELTLDGSVRAFDYDSYGSDSVWKAGLNWQVIPSVRIRGTMGTSYRAPALYELYLDELTAFQDQLLLDPCIDWGNSTNQNIRTNCAAEGIPNNYNGAGTDAQIISSGGAGLLEAETSEARTLGLIWTPDFIDLSLAIEYFDIVIDNQVTQLGENNILLGCYSAPVYPNAFCDLFERNFAAGPGQYNVTEVIDNYINVSQQATHGIDYTLRYEHEFDFGDLLIELSATQTMEDTILLFGAGVSSGFNSNDFLGSVGDPEWVGDATVQLKRDDFTYSWFIDYIGPTDNEVFFEELQDYLGRPARLINKTDPWLSHDISVRWQSDKMTVTGGILNIFDAQAPVISANGGQRLQNHALAATQYDLYGRTFFLRVGYDF